MISIYDILLNFQKDLCEFYEWTSDDLISHMRTIPLVKTDTRTIYDLKNNQFILDDVFLEKINNKSESYSEKGLKKLKYAFLLSDKNSVMAINYEENNIQRSSLLLDEENEVLNLISGDKLNCSYLSYKIIVPIEKDEFIPRIIKDKKSMVIKNLEKIRIHRDFGIIKYLYFELFEMTIKDHQKAYSKIIESLADYNNVEKIYEIIRIYLRKEKRNN